MNGLISAIAASSLRGRVIVAAIAAAAVLVAPTAVAEPGATPLATGAMLTKAGAGYATNRSMTFNILQRPDGSLTGSAHLSFQYGTAIDASIACFARSGNQAIVGVRYEHVEWDDAIEGAYAVFAIQDEPDLASLWAFSMDRLDCENYAERLGPLYGIEDPTSFLNIFGLPIVSGMITIY